MQQQHTPGPWRVDGTRIRSCAPGIDCIATMQVSNQCNWPKDARLIAAAPKLLEALRLLCHEMECTNYYGIGYEPKSDEPLGIAKAAIAKAVGHNTV